MKSVSNSPERARGLKGYLEKAIDTVWSSISDGIGSVAYSSALKTPYLTRYEIVHGSSTGILDVGANSLGIGNSVDRDLRNSLFAGRKKSVDYWDKKLEAGRISKTERDIKVAAKIRNLENRYENKLEEFKTDILPVAFNNFLEGIPDGHVVSDDKRYKGLVAASKVSHEAGLPSGLASAFLGKYGSILVVDPPHSTPPTNKFAEKKVYEVHEPGFVEREFYKIADKLFKYPMKAISKMADLMIEHPLLVGAATVTGISIAADFKYNNGKIAKNTFDYAKDSGKSIAGGVAGFFTGIDNMFDSNQLPVAKIKLDKVPVAGEPVKFNASESFDPDGKIVEYRWIFQDSEISGGLNGIKMEVTPTPTLEKVLPEGSYKVTLNVEDDKGGIGSAGTGLDMKADVQPSIREGPFIMYKNKIKIQGSEIFRENVVKVLEFLNKFSPPDYQPLMEDVNLIDLNPSTDTLRGGGGGISVNPDSVLNKQINKSNSHYIKLFAEAFRHEWGHTYVGKIPGLGEQLNREGEKICGSKLETVSDLENCTKKLGKNDFHEWYPGETYPDQFRQSAQNNLSYVTPAMIDKFNEEFNFSKAVESQ